MHIETVKTIRVRNNSGQTATLGYSTTMEYIYDMIKGMRDDERRHKVMLIKFVRSTMHSPDLRTAKIFVEDALGQ